MPDPFIVKSIFDSIARRYDAANFALSCGVFLYWRKRFLNVAGRETPKRGAVLDLCTGTGALLPGLLRRFEKVTGVDFSEPMLGIASARISSEDSGRLSLIKGDALDLPLADGSFDAVTVAYGVRNLGDLQRGLAEIHRVLMPGGKVFILEFGRPKYSAVKVAYRAYARAILPLLGGLITGNRGAYKYLLDSSWAFPSGGDFCEELFAAGFRQCRFIRLTGGIAYIYSGDK